MSEAAKYIPTRLAEASASGLSLNEPEKKGKTYRLRVQDDKSPLAWFRTERKARSVAAAAKMVYDAAMKRPPRIDKKGLLAVRGHKKHKRITYEVWELSKVLPSHDPHTWEANEDYPFAVQERDYTGSTDEKLKVEKIANDPDPHFLLARAPTAIDGPPVILFNGAVMGGNGRTMGLILAYERGTAGRYREALREKAPDFGVSPWQVDAMERPILVRVIQATKEELQGALAKLSRELNESFGNSKDDLAESVSVSRLFSLNTLSEIGKLLEDSTLREAMEAHPDKFAEVLRDDGILTDQSREEWMSGAKLSKAGKLRLEQAFLARAVETVERLRAMPPALSQKVEKMVPELVRVDARQNGHSITDALKAAIDVLVDYQSRRDKFETLEEYFAQGNLFEDGQSSQVKVLARCLDGLTQTKIRQTARAWAAMADFDPKQSTLFGAHPTPKQTFKVWEDAVQKA